MTTRFSWILILFLALVVQLSLAQEKTISGSVSDKLGFPLPGVNIIVKGTSNGTQTDLDGNFIINVKEGDVLYFTYIGLKSQEETVGASNTIHVEMVEDIIELNQVVVTAFGIVRKPDELTTSNQVVKADELIKASPQNLATALTAKVSGLNILQTFNGVNDDYLITLRGMRSFSASNEPLIVIDGVPSTTELFLALGPDMIENINVMKGANGAALYGPNGANGAIIITTKKGGYGDGQKISIDVKSTTQFENVAYLPERQTRYGQGWAYGTDFQHIAWENGSWGPEFDGTLQPVGLPLPDGTLRLFPYETLGSDNIKAFFQTGTIYDNTISVSGGNSEMGHVNLSINNLHREFIIADDRSKKTSVLLNAGKTFGKFNLQGSVQYISKATKYTYYDLMYFMLQGATNIDVTKFKDPLNETHWTGYVLSPYWIIDNIRNFDFADRINANFTAGYEIDDHINIKTTASLYSSSTHGYQYDNGYTEPTYISDITGYTRSYPSSYGAYTGSYRTLYGDVLAHFDYPIISNLSLNANLGASTQETTTTYHSVSGVGLTIPGFYNISNVSGVPDTSDSRNLIRNFAVFADATLNYKDYLYFNFTGRNDWTSLLNLNHNTFFYPSAGMSFIPTKSIDALKKSKVIDKIKLSYSYVKVGNTSGINAYDINDTYHQSSDPFTGNFPFGPINSFIPDQSLTDPNIEPEFITSHEVGLTMEMFKRRIRVDISAFKGTTKNQISKISTSFASGVIDNRINIGTAGIKGMEIDLGFTPLNSENWKWDINTSYATSKMVVTKVSDQSDEVLINGFGNFGIYATEGEPFPVLKGSDFVRDPLGRIVIDANSGNPLRSPQFQVLGHATPKYILNLNTSLRYKNFTLTATADFRTGHQFFSGMKTLLAWTGNLVESAENGRKQFIFPNSSIETSPGVYAANTNVPTAGPDDVAFMNYYGGNFMRNARNFIIDATALKVRQLTLSYTLPINYIKSLGLTNLKLSAIATNPITLLSKQNRGFADPDSNWFEGNAIGYNDWDNYPSTKTYGLSINLTF